MEKHRAIFLDRDGVINVNRVDNVRTWDQFVFESSSLEALARLGGAAFRLVVMTNQSGIGRGHMTQATVDEIHAQMLRAIERAGGRIDRIYYCPHLPDDGCACRKPLPGMLWRGRDELNLDLERSFLIGDWSDDIRAARSAGVTPILVRTGRGERALAELVKHGEEIPEVTADLAEAVEWILEREKTPELTK